VTSDSGIMLSDVNPEASDDHEVARPRSRRSESRRRRRSTRRLREFFPDPAEGLDLERRAPAPEAADEPDWLEALRAAGIPVCTACRSRNPLKAHRCLDCGALLRAPLASGERRLTDSLSAAPLPEAPRDRGRVVVWVLLLLLLLAGLGVAFALGVDWEVVRETGY